MSAAHFTSESISSKDNIQPLMALLWSGDASLIMRIWQFIWSRVSVNGLGSVIVVRSLVGGMLSRDFIRLSVLSTFLGVLFEGYPNTKLLSLFWLVFLRECRTKRPRTPLPYRVLPGAGSLVL